jgi:hypothetical protein
MEPETTEQQIARLQRQLAEQNQTDQGATPEQESSQEGAQEPSAGWAQKDRPKLGKFFKFQNIGDSIEGELVRFFESEYEGKKSNNALLRVDGKEMSFRVTTQLQHYFDGVELGKTVKVVYKGRLGKLKNFDFFVAE